MSTISKIKLIAITAFVVLSIAGLVYLCHFYYEKGYDARKTEDQHIVVADFDTAKVVQNARLHWLPKRYVDSLLALYGKPSGTYTKIRWLDSLCIKDSLNYVKIPLQYPVYEADTIFSVSKNDAKGNSVSVKTAIKQRFLPMQEMFASDIVIKEASFTAGPADTIKLPQIYKKTIIGILAGIKNKFDKDFYSYVGVEFYPFDFRFFQFYVGGEGDYNYNTKLWEGETKIGIKLRF